ncbi:MAG: hypothetical protein RJB13_1687 [Pseudomonadota bacterium]
MSQLSFESMLAKSWSMLESFYDSPARIDLLDFIRMSCGENSQVLLEEDIAQNTLFITAEFPKELKQQVEKSDKLDLQVLSVVSEELSHLFHLVHAAQNETQLSVFQLECIAEIDRFISFLHWDAFCPEFPLPVSLTNCHQVCDVLFESRSFQTKNESLYREAESFAFFHLRNAFSHIWNQRELDKTTYDPLVKRYIMQLCQPRTTKLKSA